jgi:hypothetical protein
MRGATLVAELSAKLDVHQARLTAGEVNPPHCDVGLEGNMRKFAPCPTSAGDHTRSEQSKFRVTNPPGAELELETPKLMGREDGAPPEPHRGLWFNPALCYNRQR